MMRRIGWGAFGLMAISMTACPIYSDSGSSACYEDIDCAPGYLCAGGGFCVADGTLMNRCAAPEACPQNFTCGRDAYCHPGDCSYTTTGCVRGYTCALLDGQAGYACVPGAGDAGADAADGGDASMIDRDAPGDVSIDAIMSAGSTDPSMVICGAETCRHPREHCCFETEGAHASVCETASCGMGRGTAVCDAPSDCPGATCCAIGVSIASANVDAALAPLAAWTVDCRVTCPTIGIASPTDGRGADGTAPDGGGADGTAPDGGGADGTAPDGGGATASIYREICTGGPTLNTCSKSGQQCVPAPALPTGYKWCITP